MAARPPPAATALGGAAPGLGTRPSPLRGIGRKGRGRIEPARRIRKL